MDMYLVAEMNYLVDGILDIQCNTSYNLTLSVLTISIYYLGCLLHIERVYQTQ